MTDSLLNHLELPDVMRLRATHNAHENITTLIKIIHTQPIQAALVGTTADKQLVAALQLERFTILADNLAFIANTPARQRDLENLINALDALGHLQNLRAIIKPAPATQHLHPHAALDTITNTPTTTGAAALRQLLSSLSPEYGQDI